MAMLNRRLLIRVLFFVLPLALGGPASATTILVYISRDSTAIAADSQANRIEGGTRKICKISQTSPTMMFAAVGIGHFDNPPFDPYELARTVANRTSDPASAASQYATDAISPLQNIWNRIRSRYLEIGRSNGLSTEDLGICFVFAGISSATRLVAAGGCFKDQPPSATLSFTPFTIEPTTESDVYFWRSGVTSALPDDASVARLIGERGVPAALEQLITKQAEASPNLVALPATVVTVRRDGKIEWHSRGACSQ